MAMVDEGSICCTSAAASSRADVGRAVSTRPQTQSFENEGNLESRGIFLPWVGGAWVKKGRGGEGKEKERRRREATRQEIGITKQVFENIVDAILDSWGRDSGGWCDSIDSCRRVVSMRIQHRVIEWLVIWDFTCVEIETMREG